MAGRSIRLEKSKYVNGRFDFVTDGFCMECFTTFDAKLESCPRCGGPLSKDIVVGFRFSKRAALNSVGELTDMGDLVTISPELRVTSSTTIERIANEDHDGPDPLVSIESTIPLNMSREMARILGRTRKHYHVVHVPHRYFKNEQDIHGVNQQRVIGGLDDCCVYAGKAFYESLLGIPLLEVKLETAEATKITENAYRYMTIAFAEELVLYCQKRGLDFEELRRACNSKWNVNIPEARDGIAGHCLPKDSMMYLHGGLSTSLIRTALNIDEMYQADLARKKQRKNDRRPADLVASQK